MTDYTEADRAIIARIGGNEYRRRLHDRSLRDTDMVPSMGVMDDYIRDTTESLAANQSHLGYQYHAPWSYIPVGETEPVYHAATVSGPDHRMWPRLHVAKVPESSFDWPIYRAAMVRLVIETLANEGGDDAIWMSAQNIGNALNLWPSDG